MTKVCYWLNQGRQNVQSGYAECVNRVYRMCKQGMQDV